MKPRHALCALLTALSLTGLLAATAHAAATLPSVLPEPTAGTGHLLGSFTSKKVEFGFSLKKFLVNKGEGTLEGLSGKLGFSQFLFLEMKLASGEPCLGLVDTVEESMSTAGTYHLRDFKNGGTLRVALIDLLVPVHFECEKILFLASGCVAGQVTPENTLTKHFAVILETTKEDNLIITVLNEEGIANELCQLLVKEGAGTTKLAAVTATYLSGNGTKAGVATEILVMAL